MASNGRIEFPVVLSSLLFCLDGEIVGGDEKVDGVEVAFDFLGKRIGPAHQAAQA